MWFANFMEHIHRCYIKRSIFYIHQFGQQIFYSIVPRTWTCLAMPTMAKMTAGLRRPTRPGERLLTDPSNIFSLTSMPIGSFSLTTPKNSTRLSKSWGTKLVIVAVAVARVELDQCCLKIEIPCQLDFGLFLIDRNIHSCTFTRERGRNNGN